MLVGLDAVVCKRSDLPNAAITCPQIAVCNFRNILAAGQVHGNVILFLQ
jgi:hypothetical protein